MVRLRRFSCQEIFSTGPTDETVTMSCYEVVREAQPLVQATTHQIPATMDAHTTAAHKTLLLFKHECVVCRCTYMYTHVSRMHVIHVFVCVCVFTPCMDMRRWDGRSSVATPDEDVFYLVAFLRSALDSGEETQTLEYLTNQNRQILSFCEEAEIDVKQYLPHYSTHQEWMDHFGDKWARFQQRKMEFDPRRILATGQSIFKPSLNADTASW